MEGGEDGEKERREGGRENNIYINNIHTKSLVRRGRSVRDSRMSSLCLCRSPLSLLARAILRHLNDITFYAAVTANKYC